MWLAVHITFLTGFRNRFAALLHWAGTFAAGSRAERTITLRQVVARRALEEAGGDAVARHALAAGHEDRPTDPRIEHP
jgi:NADH dehydrogenase